MRKSYFELPRPQIQELDRELIKLPCYQQEILDNGVQLCMVNNAKHPVVKVEVLINSSRWHEAKKVVGMSSNVLWKEGTANISGEQAANTIDFYGATLQTVNSLDHSAFTLYSLDKFLPKVLPLVIDLLTAPVFPQDELDTFIERNIARLKITATKPDVQGYRLLTEALFGQEHPYGFNSKESFFKSLTRDDLLDHHFTHVKGGNTFVMASGSLSKASHKLLKEQFGRLTAGSTKEKTFTIKSVKPQVLRHELPNSVQSAVRLGRIMNRRSHSDAPGLHVLNTILGGYFGSRLMSEIREKRGLTYNIYSSIDSLRHASYLFLSAEVAQGNEQETLQAIKEEIQVLRENLVGEDELNMVKNYLMGSYMSMVDGAFNQGETIKVLLSEKMPVTYFDRLVDVTKEISAEQLMSLAQKYLDPEELVTVIVGP